MDGGVEITNGTSDAICESVTVGIGPDGQAVVTAAIIALPVVENCDALDLKVDGQMSLAFDCSQLGAHVVTLNLADRLGNTATCTAKVEVVDDLSPVFENCPADLVVQAAGAETPVSWTEPTATDNCALESVTATHQPGDLFPVGTTQVTYEAKDVNGQSSQCNFLVTVVPAGDCADVRAIRRVMDTYDNCGSWCNGPYVLAFGAGKCFTAGDDLLFIEYHDGTALLTGSIRQGSARGYVEVYFSGRTETAPSGSPKYGLCTQSGGDSWYYYTTFKGLVFLPDGDRVKIERYGPAFQVGIGANLQDPNLLGASGWIQTGSSHGGDFNFRLAPEPAVCENTVWLEAECATAIGGAWKVVDEADASNGLALRAPANKNSYDAPPATDADKVVFEVAVAQPGSYRIFARAKAVNSSTDSYWVRVNGGAWVKWNKINRIYGYPDAYAWDQVGV
ncbi:MAG: HYR domain-containing protein, partial [Bacteroidetes bacterium]